MRALLAALGLAAALLAGAFVPRALAGLPDNDWVGLRGPASTGALATCSLGDARATTGASVWAAVTGHASLDIIQIGARVSSRGTRYFAAWGRGEPYAAGSLYIEQDLGPADRRSHKYTVELVGAVWSLSIDGVTRLRVKDDWRTWPLTAAQVMHETEGSADQFGGSWWKPVSCDGARARDGSRWYQPPWSLTGYGQKAMSAKVRSGADWFRVTRSPRP